MFWVVDAVVGAVQVGRAVNFGGRSGSMAFSSDAPAELLCVLVLAVRVGPAACALPLRSF